MQRSKLFIYADLTSQPVRSVVSFCKINKIDFEIVDIFIMKGQNRSEEYLKINPHGKLPSIKIVEENGEEFILYESCAILRFLSQKYQTPCHWYNRGNIKRKALIDQYLDWHHSNTRVICSGTFFPEFVIPLLEKQGIQIKDKPESQRKNLPKLLSYLNSVLEKTKFIIDDEITIADLMLYEELVQLLAINYDYSNYKALNNYINLLSEIHEIKETNSLLRKITVKNNLKPKF